MSKLSKKINQHFNKHVVLIVNSLENLEEKGQVTSLYMFES